jgi:hypothetical protein
MANEFSVTCKLSFSTGGTTWTNATTTKTASLLDAAKNKAYHATPALAATTWERVDSAFTDVTVASGYRVLIRNIGTGVVTAAPAAATTNAWAQIQPGDFALTTIYPGVALYLYATIAGDVEIVATDA